MGLRKAHITGVGSIQTTMVACFFALVVGAMAIFLVISIFSARSVVYDNSISYATRIITQVNRELDDYIDYMANISDLVAQDDDVQQYLFGEPGADTQHLKSNIVSQFRSIRESRKDIYNVAVVANDGTCLVNDGEEGLTPYVDVPSLVWYQAALDKGDTVSISPSHVQNAIKSSYQWVITLSRALVNEKTGAAEGVFFIDLNYSAISDLCNNNSVGKSYLFIIDKDGNVIYHPKQDLIYGGLLTEHVSEILESDADSLQFHDKNGTQIYTKSTSEKTGWTVVGVSDMDDLTKSMYQLRTSYITAALVLLAASLGISLYMSRTITRPLRELKDSMSMVQQGVFEKVDASGSPRNEIVSLGSSFNIMIERIEQLIELNVQEQEEKRKIELRALWAQIKPHFLYNTLDSIIWMSEAGQNEQVVRMTSALAKLLRQSISNDREEVTVHEEMAYVDSYLIIQQMRYRDKLEYDIDVDDEVLDVSIVKLSVQPLVENAIYHGLKYKDGKGKIEIRGFAEDDTAYVTVSDDGIGMDEETLSNIFEVRDEGDEHTGIGIANVQRRLQMHYGAEYGITYDSEPGEGTMATIVLPLKVDERGEESR